MGKCSDLSVVNLLGVEHEGYVPDDIGVGGGDYIRFDLCLNCGKVQGKFPLPDPKFYLEEESEDEEDE